MVVNCEEVWQEVSNYLDGGIDSRLRAAVEEHLRGCKHCTAVVDGTRNVLELYGDHRLLKVPLGYSQRLHHHLDAAIAGKRGTGFGWMVAFAAAAALMIGFEVGSSSAFSQPHLRSAHAQPPARAIPANLMVVVTDQAKTFHLPGCGVIHNKSTERMLTAAEAEREGYVPCVRCLRKYVNLTGWILREDNRGGGPRSASHLPAFNLGRAEQWLESGHGFSGKEHG
jgi:hypothetical protein